MWQFLDPLLNACFQLLSIFEKPSIVGVEVWQWKTLTLQKQVKIDNVAGLVKSELKYVAKGIPFLANIWNIVYIANKCHSVNLYYTLSVSFI